MERDAWWPMIDARVNAGVKWLDSVKPLWVDDIDLERLDMKHPERCIIGQTDLSFEADVEWDDPFPSDLGFNADLETEQDDEEEIDMLQEAWTRWVKIRRLPA